MTHALKNNSLPVQLEGLPYILAGGLLTAAGAVLWNSTSFAVPATALSALFTAFAVNFYRNPERQTPQDDPTAVFSPADGRVLFVREVPGGRIGLEKAMKVAIFMSPLDVHVNRAPMAGRVESVEHTVGKFFKADLDKASEENEHNWIVYQTDLGPKLAFNQIAGFIARRIVCYVEGGERLKAGERLGMIRFGSRMEILVPPGTEVLVKAGDKTAAGVTRLARLKA